MTLLLLLRPHRYTITAPPQVSYFSVPLSITFATADAASNSLEGTGRITVVDGQAGVLAVDGTPRITAVA